ncbi:MAG: hypothetical protein IPQ10_05805 [Saprospiraceae bacterium]|jgi:hypothetical protein|nr:hypothetical protein [Saprospiraceae bacterium]MBK7795460.1 hypothetical protein [Saprospiraceae bacterium]MBK8153986.1 hypothetical protein [Saprospiraceae bacterium]MBK9379128.1 hypothetical protein [Saprospiraceae bacterium]MBL0260571.1 hypothetical protein [Saprospiraceae bacterium]
MNSKTSQHILSTSTNLLGFCLFVITSLHFSNKADDNLIDEFTSLVALLLAVSSIFSFFSLRTENSRYSIRLETIADYIFVVSLVGVLSIILFMLYLFW